MSKAGEQLPGWSEALLLMREGELVRVRVRVRVRVKIRVRVRVRVRVGLGLGPGLEGPLISLAT